MSDLESRLTEGLSGTAERAPHPPDLTAGARDRLRRRRRTTTAVVVASLAVVAIPVGLAVVQQTGDDPDRRDPTTVSETPGGWRAETWRDLSVNVPPEWGFGGGTDWCTAGSLEQSGAQVSRPGGVIPMIACKPSYGYGAHFLEPSSGELPPGTEGVIQQYRGDRYPDDAWIGYASTQQAAVWVVAEDRTTARQVLDSATPVGEVDANGCATRLEMDAPSSLDRMSVCRYDGNGWLEQSELLSPEDTDAAVRALDTAPLDDDGRPCDFGLTGGFEAIVLRGADRYAQVTLEGPCEGLDDSADPMAVRELTSDVLYWALSPGWSGSVPGAAPDRLRQQ